MNAGVRDPYEVLGVARDADADTIKSAYRRQAMKHHPDRNPGDKTAEDTFKRLSEAYALLRDPQARQHYDRYGRSDPRSYRAPDPSTVDWQTIFREADIPINWGQTGEMPRTGNAVFDVLFGVMTGMLRNSGLLPGETREVVLELSLGEAVNGTSKRVRVPGPSVCAVCRGTGRANLDTGSAGAAGAAVTGPQVGPFDDSASATSCPACGGRGVRRGSAFVDVNVPAGSKNNTKLRLKGLGGPGRPPGDLMVDVELKLPEGAEVRGRDVHDGLTITPMVARSGGEVVYQGLKVKVPAGVRSGGTLRLPGQGLAGGNLLLRVEVDLLGGIGRSVGTTVGRFLRKLTDGGPG
ncbi:MAG TPA: DnaJ domain-containing protein [Trueperaceae bacterium]|nr:DnaJ domain-containing protein [Trueperaceae bacterium]